jgi:hypothetical protein
MGSQRAGDALEEPSDVALQADTDPASAATITSARAAEAIGVGRSLISPP